MENAVTVKKKRRFIIQEQVPMSIFIALINLYGFNSPKLASFSDRIGFDTPQLAAG